MMDRDPNRAQGLWARIAQSLKLVLLGIPRKLIIEPLSSGGQRILAVLKTIEAVGAVIAFATAFGLVFAQVAARELFHSNISGAKEGAILGTVIAGFLGFSLVTGANSHLRANFMDGLAPKHNMDAFIRISDAIAVVILTSFAVASYVFVQGSFEFTNRVNTLLIPLWPFQTVMVYAFGASALKHLIFFINPDLKPASPEVAR